MESDSLSGRSPAEISAIRAIVFTYDTSTEFPDGKSMSHGARRVVYIPSLKLLVKPVESPRTSPPSSDIFAIYTARRVDSDHYDAFRKKLLADGAKESKEWVPTEQVTYLDNWARLLAVREQLEELLIPKAPQQSL
ncbi:MAG: hypothetical protein HY362_03150 [Candidatus Aenigmarchaeota archaeon]|nr:hypothetical protein [Candidatus Aenigmarchaeota archaeon]